MLSVLNNGLINVVHDKFIDKLVSIKIQSCSCQRFKRNDAQLGISASISNF